MSLDHRNPGDGAPATTALTDEESEVRKSLEAYRAAMVIADSRALGHLVAAQLSYSHSSGHVEDKAAFIAHATTKFKSLEFQDITVSVVGDTAIGRFHWVGLHESDGKANHTSLAVLMVWQKQDGAWKLLARATCKI